MKTEKPEKPTVLILMGPMGCGKSTIGRLLARELDWPFIDGDDFHPPENVHKMRQGIALTDSEREPWLDRLRVEIDRWLADCRSGVLACSALKHRYRERLGVDQEQVRTVYLEGDVELLRDRIGNRSHRYMNPSLLESQLDTLEVPDGGLRVDIAKPPETIVASVARFARS